MSSIHLLYKDELPVNDKIGIKVPKLRDVLEQEDDYYSMVSMLTAEPIDMMVQLDDMGIDFTQITDYELFLYTFTSIREMDTSLIFGDLDLKAFELAVNEKTDMPVLVDRERDIVIDRLIYEKITSILRKINHLEKNNKKPGNEEARQYLIERARAKQKRRKSRSEQSELEQLIIALVNTEQCGYGFEGILELSIYQFNESVHQIISKVNYDNRMHGVYAGTVDTKQFKPEDFNWLTHK